MAGAPRSGKNRVSLQRQSVYSSSTDTADVTGPVLVLVGHLSAWWLGHTCSFALGNQVNGL